MQATVVTKLIVITFLVYLLDNLFLNNLLTDRYLGLDAFMFHGPGEVKPHFKLWQLLTYGFTHARMGEGHGIMHIGMNMYGLWFFGRPLEQRYGAAEFLAFYLSAIVLSAVIYVGYSIAMPPNHFSHGLIGASGGVSAVIFLFAVSFPKLRVRLMFPPVVVPMWALGAFIIFMDLRGAASSGGDNIAHEAHLAGVGLAMLYYFTRFSFTGGRWKAQQRHVAKQKAVLQKKSFAQPPRHTCVICNRTNVSDPELDFRYCSKCVGTPCYCMEHLNEHEHVTTAPTESA